MWEWLVYEWHEFVTAFSFSNNLFFFLLPFIYVWSKWGSWRNPYGIDYNPKLPSRFTWKLVYSDEKPDKPVEGVTYSTILKSEQYDITGKPDFVYQRKNHYMPVELKSHALGVEKKAFNQLKPRDKDLHQLYMYFLIVGETYGKVHTGEIIYKDCMFTVVNDRRARKKIIRILDDMRHMLDNPDTQAPNSSFINCKHCVCRETVCEHHD